MIDRKALDRLGDWGGPKLVKEMLRLFQDNSVERHRGIRDGLEAGDAELVKRSAHSLKSSAANVGAADVSAEARAIEHAAAEDDLEGARAAERRLDELLGPTLRELSDIEEGLDV